MKQYKPNQQTKTGRELKSKIEKEKTKYKRKGSSKFLIPYLGRWKCEKW